MKKPFNTYMQIRINTEDKEKLAIYCSKNNLTFSEFVRNSIVYFGNSNNENMIFHRDKKFKRELLYEINRYGNNLNQVAYNLNRLFKADITSLQAQAIDESLLRLSKIEEELSTIRKIISERL